MYCKVGRVQKTEVGKQNYKAAENLEGKEGDGGKMNVTVRMLKKSLGCRCHVIHDGVSGRAGANGRTSWVHVCLMWLTCIVLSEGRIKFT